jgi:hypothetical protein
LINEDLIEATIEPFLRLLSLSSVSTVILAVEVKSSEVQSNRKIIGEERETKLAVADA